jgi:hypothetical protein
MAFPSPTTTAASDPRSRRGRSGSEANQAQFAAKGPGVLPNNYHPVSIQNQRV